VKEKDSHFIRKLSFRIRPTDPDIGGEGLREKKPSANTSRCLFSLLRQGRLSAREAHEIHDQARSGRHSPNAAYVVAVLQPDGARRAESLAPDGLK
jgi:hypothetical protein